MGYIEELRKLIGNQPLILVRPSVAVINKFGQILLVKYQDGSWGITGGLMELGESVEECMRREVKEEIESYPMKSQRHITVFTDRTIRPSVRQKGCYLKPIQ